MQLEFGADGIEFFLVGDFRSTLSLSPRLLVRAHSPAIIRATVFQVVTLLVSEGAQLNSEGQDNCTAMHFAAEHGHLGIVKYLCAVKANPNALDVNEETPLMLAAA